MLAWPLGVLLAISFVTCTVTNITKNWYSRKISTSTRGTWFFVLVQCLATAVLIFAINGGMGEFSWYSLFMGLIFGVVGTLQLITFMYAIAIGPFSYSSVISSMATLIPTLAGAIFWNEKISIFQWIGIVLMVVCIVFSTDKPKTRDDRKVGTKWLLIILTSTVLGGFIGILQKMHQTSVYKDQTSLFLVSSFLISAAIAGVMMVICRNKRQGDNVTPAAKTAWKWLIPLISGLSFAFPHIINLYLSGVLEAAIMFPVVNLGPLVLTTVAAAVIFKEKLSVRQWIGICIGIVSTLFVSGVISF
ncbi:MAG: EamA family transporter [Clostridia bacterium]|nr:EamA family transporter [Clostridia bacterium]